MSLKKPGEYPYLTMTGGSCGSGAYTLSWGRPPYEKMGWEISFEHFPEGCRRLVLDIYRELWNL